MSKATFEKIAELNDSSILRTRKGHCSKGTSNTPNWHEALEILCCVSGCGTVLLDDRKYLFKEGSIIIVNSQVIHSVYAAQDLEFDFIQLDKNFCATQLIDLQQIRFSECIENDECLAEILKGITKPTEDNGFLNKAKKSYAALQLIIYLCENHRQNNEDVSALYDVSFGRVKKAMIYIKQNYEKEFSLESIALAVGINKYQLTREFKAVTGESVFEFLNSLRCKEASRMLKQGASVTEAAYSCGFSNLSYFSRTYKKYNGFLPSETKKNN